MINIEVVDKMFHAGEVTGAPIEFHIFDRRWLIPLEALPDAVKAETGIELTLVELRARSEAGWFPILPREGTDKPGATLYTASRVALLTDLAAKGFEESELRLCAEYEEALIDCVLTVEDFEYIDDDLLLLIAHTKSLVESLETSHSYENGEMRDERAELEQHRRHLAFFEKLQRDGIPLAIEPKIAKHAYRVRAFNEMTRLSLAEEDRAQLRQGYSPTVQFRKWSARPFQEYKFEGILWDSTLRSAVAHDEMTSGPTIRVPGFTLRGDDVVPTNTMRPAEYGRLWKEHDLDGYLQAWAKISGARLCANCFEPLSPTAHERKQFCGEKCRNAAKQRRFREHNPAAAEKAQRTYWGSIDDE